MQAASARAEEVAMCEICGGQAGEHESDCFLAPRSVQVLEPDGDTDLEFTPFELPVELRPEPERAEDLASLIDSMSLDLEPRDAAPVEAVEAEPSMPEQPEAPAAIAEPEPPAAAPRRAATPEGLLEIEHLETMIEHTPELDVQSDPPMFGYEGPPRSVLAPPDIIPGDADTKTARKRFARR